MKNFLVIGNPIEHSLSPELHNYWIKKNNISAIYNKEKLDIEDLEKLVLKIKEKKIHGVNVTVPFKKEIISHVGGDACLTGKSTFWIDPNDTLKDGFLLKDNIKRKA